MQLDKLKPMVLHGEMKWHSETILTNKNTIMQPNRRGQAALKHKDYVDQYNRLKEHQNEDDDPTVKVIDSKDYHLNQVLLQQTKTPAAPQPANFIITVNADFCDEVNSVKSLVDPIMPPELVVLNLSSDLMDSELSTTVNSGTTIQSHFYCRFMRFEISKNATEKEFCLLMQGSLQQVA